MRTATLILLVLLPTAFASALLVPSTRPVEPKPLDVLRLRQQLARSLAAEGEKLLAAGDAAAAARKFREAAGLALETPTTKKDVRDAKRQALIEKHARELLVKARAMRKAGKMLGAYRHAVQVLYITPFDEPARKLAVETQLAALAEWKAAWAKLLAGRRLQIPVGEIPNKDTLELSPADRAVWKRLRLVVPEISFKSTKFEDVIKFLRNATKANIHVKWGALEEMGVMRDTPVSTKFKKITLHTALRIILDDVSGSAGRDDRLNFVVRDGVLRISTNDDLDKGTYIVVYDIDDLLRSVGPPELPAMPGYDIDGGPGYLLIDCISWRIVVKDIADLLWKTVDPECWIGGSPASATMKFINGKLVIGQIARNHRQIRGILRLLRWINQPAPSAARSRPAESAASKTARVLGEKLGTVLPKIKFDNSKFADVIQFFRDATACSIYVRWRALEEVGIMKDTPVRMRLGKVSLRTALKILLDDVSGSAGREDRLAFVQRSGVLLISTRADLDKDTFAVLYDVRDLLVDIVGKEVVQQESLLGLNGCNDGGLVDDGDDDDDDDDDWTDDDAQVNADKWPQAENEMIDLLQKTVDPESWVEGSPTSGSVRFILGVLVINQTSKNHEQIAKLLAMLRKKTAAKLR